MKDLKGDAIVARDGELGSVRDVYFDDQRWAVRYLVVDTGKWLPGRKVLISPASVTGADERSLRVALSREQVQNAPDPGEDPPVSRLMEEAHAKHYGYPPYWTGPYLWGATDVPLAEHPAEYGEKQSRAREEAQEQAAQRARETHLRSSSEVVGYRIQAADGEIGHVEDFLVDDRSWAIADMVVDTGNWLPGRKVRVAPSAIEDIDWNGRQVRVRLTRAEIERSAELH
ncbi:MAG TPA: PRC-barrel domain-containing protein [Burkholderiales bacterium]|nr:PRC-barrel domain-containing protein [Burkholderiales bacterium]